MSSPANPYLSIVFVVRNDDYGGDFNERLQNSVNWLSHFIEKLELPTELFLVNYNPMSERAPLTESINWPCDRSYLQIRMLTVPTETHQEMVNPEIRYTVPVFEFPAKNVALRRARGEYIISTNADILLDPQILEFVKKQKATKGNYYRADRYDYHRLEKYDFDDTSALLKEIQKNIFIVHFKGYAFELKDGLKPGPLKEARRKNAKRIKKNLNSLKWESLAIKRGWTVVYDNIPQKFHTHCSGDFMMMHRDYWHELRGYPEETLISTHVDALFTVMAGTSGLKEVVLKHPLYHQDHERRYVTNVSRDDADNRIQHMYDRLTKEGKLMVAQKAPIIYNDENWGLGNRNFEEQTF